MVIEVITSNSFDAASEVLSQTIEAILELVGDAKNVFIEKESFAKLASYWDNIIPLLKELRQKDINSEGLNNVVNILSREIKVAKELCTECSNRNKVYLLVNCRSIAKSIQNSTREISQALSLVPLASLDVSSSIIDGINHLCENMQTAEFNTAVAEEKILEKIESGIQERTVDRSYANNLLFSIAEAVGISTERSALKKEIEEFKIEIENVRLKKDHAEAMQMDQIIALLERADAASSPEEKEIKYYTKRNSLGSQQLEPLHSFICPITREVMADPVETSSGHTFERSAIEKWFAEGYNLCPLTLNPLDTSILRPNKTLQQSIEEWRDRNTMITIASIKTKLMSEEEEEVLHCLDQLHDLCKERDIYREWIILENYIPTLIKLLGSKKRDIRNHCLVILCNLAKDSNDAKERIARVDSALIFVVRSLGRRIDEGKLAVALLLELSNSDLVKDSIVKVQGCILLLVTMTSSGDSEAARDARDLLQNLSFSDQNVIQMAKANYFEHLLQLLSSGPDDVKMKMAATLAEIELTDHNKSALFAAGVLGSLLHLLSYDDIQMKEVAVKALQNLSSLPKNGQEMIKQGAIDPLLGLIHCHTLPQSLREHVAATIMHVAVSTTSQHSSNAPIPILESDEDLYRLFSLITLTGPTIQHNILRAFHAMCDSCFATNVKAKLKQWAVQVLVPLCDIDDINVRANAVKLFYCLTKDGGAMVMLDTVGEKTIETLIKIIENSNDEEEIMAAIGIISNFPESHQITEWLLKAGGLPIIFDLVRNGRHNGPCQNQLTENAAGAMCHFTVPTNLQSQRKVAEAGAIPVLVQLLDSGTSLTKRNCALSLAQLSESSPGLSQPISKGRAFCCCSPSPDVGCPVHQGICSVESSFCLVEAGAVRPLVRVLGQADPGAFEAALDALLTLIEGERLHSGSKVLDEAKAIPSMIKLLSTPSPQMQEKVLKSLERIFRLGEFKRNYGASAQMRLVELTQRSNSTVKSLAARVLAQLDVLDEQSSYF